MGKKKEPWTKLVGSTIKHSPSQPPNSENVHIVRLRIRQRGKSESQGNFKYHHCSRKYEPVHIFPVCALSFISHPPPTPPPPPPPPRPLLQSFQQREVQVSEGPLNRSKHLRSTKPKRPEANIVPGPPYRQLGPEIGPSMTTAILRWVQRVQCHNMATITATYRRCPIGGRKG